MTEELEDKIELMVGIGNYTSRKELTQKVRKYLGGDAVKLLMKYWKERYLGFNGYGYITITQKWALAKNANKDGVLFPNC